MPEPEDLDYTVEIWSEGFGRIDRVLARCARVDIAWGAYGAAQAAFPDENLSLRHKTRIVSEQKVR